MHKKDHIQHPEMQKIKNKKPETQKSKTTHNPINGKKKKKKAMAVKV